MKKRILVISNLYPSNKDPFYGTFVKNFIDDLSKSQAIQELDMCVIKGRSYKLYNKILKYIVFYIQILFSLSFKKYDLVYVHIITHAAFPLRLVSIFRKLPLTFNIHGEDLLTQTRLASYFLQMAIPLLKQAKLIVVPSQFFKSKVLEILPMIPESKLYVSASGGVNESFFNSNKHKLNDTPVIGYVSRIDRGKGWDIFIQSLHILKQKGFNFRGKIIGRGTDISKMKDLIDKLQLQKETDYVGPVEYHNLPIYYSQFDLFIFPTQLEESLGLVGLEAMACKVPVIGSRIGGLTDYIKDGINGYFFNPLDATDLSNKIRLFFSKSILEQQNMKEAAYNTALEYSSTKVSNNLISKILS